MKTLGTVRVVLALKRRKSRLRIAKKRCRTSGTMTMMTITVGT
jgi:hypothetical protein